MADIAEMNRLRASLGVAPLPVPGAAGPAFKAATGNDSDEEPASTIESREAAGYDNWKKLEDEAAAKKKREARAAAIKKEREKAARFAKLEGKGLADEAADEDDIAWLKNSKKRQKKIAKAEKTQQEQEERERQAKAALEYTEADLAGVKVGHELDQFDDEDQILVLKDTAVDDDEDDELEAVSLKEKEKLQEKLDSKKRKRAYDPNDMDEAGQSSILAQYDEEIDGKKRKAFTLNGQGTTVEDVQLDASGAPKPKKVAVSLDFLKEETATNDYMDISEVKVKKPKKKKSKSSRRKHVENEEDAFEIPEEAAEDEMDVDEPETVAPKPKKDFFDASFVDDDDLQANLATQRKLALKNKKAKSKNRVADFARQLLEQDSATPDVQDTIEEDEEPGLVLDETTEFVENLKQPGTEDEPEERPRKRQKSSQPSNGVASVGVASVEVDEEGDIDMAQSYAEVGEERERVRSVSVGITGTGLEEEKTIDQGLGATLALLKQRGVLKTSENGDQNALYRERQHFLNEKQRAEAAAERLAKEQREKERTSARWNNMTPREREEWARKNNTNRDHLESRKLADIFNKEYKPNVTLNYVDEFGRHMNQKEAFKKLSHQFHGKTSGNTKTKKHLEKIEAEKKKAAEPALETTHAGGLGSARGQQAKKTKQAGVRLL